MLPPLDALDGMLEDDRGNVVDTGTDTDVVAALTGTVVTRVVLVGMDDDPRVLPELVNRLADDGEVVKEAGNVLLIAVLLKPVPLPVGAIALLL